VRYLLDTNVYFHTLHDPAYLARYRAALLQVTPQTFLSSVVRLELVQGARGDIARARVGKAVEPLERVGRVLAPTHSDWMQAGVTQGRIWDDHPSSRTKALQNDILIVCTARRIGAIIITENTADFDMIRPYVPHRALTMEEMARQLGG
jgi:predicted nucleic acid-binding protein